MVMICEGCKKIDVCKYIEQIREFEKTEQKEEVPEVIQVTYKCKYKDNGQIFRGI